MIAKEANPASPQARLALQLLLTASTVLAATVLLSSCGILPPREPIAIYQPEHSPAPVQANWPKVDWSLLVSRPVAGQQIDSDRISVLPAPGTVQVYKGASWSDAAPDLLQVALLRGFEESQKILSVSRSGGGVRGQFQLLTELRAFQSEYAQPGQPQAIIEMSVRLVHTSDGRVVAAHTFRETEPAAGETVPAVVGAFSRALDRVTGQVVGWTLENGSRDDQAASAR